MAARGHVRFTQLSHNDSLVSPCSHRGLPTEHDFVRRLRVAGKWMVPQGGGSHTYTHMHHTYIYTTRIYRQLVWSLFVPRSSRVRCIYIYIHICVCIRIYIYICTYTYIKRSTSHFVFLFLSIHPSIFRRLSFKYLFPRPVSEAGLHGRHSRLGRDPSTIDSETRYRNLCARERATPSLAPGETTGKSAADCNQPSLRTSALHSA